MLPSRSLLSRGVLSAAPVCPAHPEFPFPILRPFDPDPSKTQRGTLSMIQKAASQTTSSRPQTATALGSHHISSIQSDFPPSPQLPPHTFNFFSLFFNTPQPYEKCPTSFKPPPQLAAARPRQGAVRRALPSQASPCGLPHATHNSVWDKVPASSHARRKRRKTQ